MFLASTMPTQPKWACMIALKFSGLFYIRPQGMTVKIMHGDTGLPLSTVIAAQPFCSGPYSYFLYTRATF